VTRALTRYHVLHASLISRRRRPEAPRGLDRLATRLATRLRHARITPSHLARQARLVDALSPTFRDLSDAALDQRLALVRDAFIRREVSDAALREALALIREVARRVTGEEAYPEQLMGALALVRGHVIEMLTGEGKTLTGSLAAPLIAWQRRHLHILTVNDYLARRDADSRAPVYARCGLSCDAVVHDTDPASRARAYALPIVYGTPKQIVADWLRDQIRLTGLSSPWTARLAVLSAPEAMAPHLSPLVPGLSAALIDEADAVLIDECATPLIIAAARRDDPQADLYRHADRLASQLRQGRDYRIDVLRRSAELTRVGRETLARLRAALNDPIWRATRRAEELVRQALVARHCYHPGRHYHVVDGRVLIVDEYTGRFLPDRSWEHGLHQAVEAKEGLTITADRETLARVSFQRFFRSYPFLCGMTGTAASDAPEIETVYARPVTRIPTHRPVIRRDLPPRVFRSALGRWTAVAEEVERVAASGRPVLIGTRSIAASELLGELLTRRGLPHRVLNALHDADEARLIADAGQPGAVTVATNMAGRGTDIRLAPEARDAGGLHVILTEMHAARRIDRQFIGRAGRQGDPGSSRLMLSLEDELLVHHVPRLAALLRARARLLAGPSRALEGMLAQRPGFDELADPRPALAAFRLAQARAEARARLARANVLRQDDWMERHLPT
jgi:preprotein translocase subunit SecA